MKQDPGIVFEWDGPGELTDDIPRPTPAHQVLPEWYKHIPPKINGGSTVKLCTSFGDAMKAGYIIPLPFDIDYTHSGNELSAFTTSPEKSVKIYGQSTPDTNRNVTLQPPELRIRNPWKIKTPPGYSSLISYPLNRTHPGIKPYTMLVDTDEWTGPINIPVTTTETQAKIPKGTPFIHVIPIHRDGFLPEPLICPEDEYPDLYDGYIKGQQRSASVPAYYRRYCWVPKAASNLHDLTASNASLDENTALRHDDIDFPTEYKPAVGINKEDYGVFPDPVPADDMLPGWIVNPSNIPNADREDHQIGTWAHNAMQIGWNTPCPFKVKITVKDGNPEISALYDRDLDKGIHKKGGVSGVHPDTQLGSKFPAMNFQILKLHTGWFNSTPEGYSIMIREPINLRQDWFQCSSGIADSDRTPIETNILGPTQLADGEYHLSPGEPLTSAIPMHRDAFLTTGYVIQ